MWRFWIEIMNICCDVYVDTIIDIFTFIDNIIVDIRLGKKWYRNKIIWRLKCDMWWITRLCKLCMLYELCKEIAAMIDEL